MNQWIQTDEYQWQKKLDEGLYEMAELRSFSTSEQEGIYAGIVSISDYSDEEIHECLELYGYKVIDQVEERIIAECLFECIETSELKRVSVSVQEWEAVLGKVE